MMVSQGTTVGDARRARHRAVPSPSASAASTAPVILAWKKQQPPPPPSSPQSANPLLGAPPATAAPSPLSGALSAAQVRNLESAGCFTPLHYEVVRKIAITSEPETGSAGAVVGWLGPGTLVPALERRTDSRGMVRLRTPMGWLSMAAPNGQMLLRFHSQTHGGRGDKSTSPLGCAHVAAHQDNVAQFGKASHHRLLHKFRTAAQQQKPASKAATLFISVAREASEAAQKRESAMAFEATQTGTVLTEEASVVARKDALLAEEAQKATEQNDELLTEDVSEAAQRDAALTEEARQAMEQKEVALMTVSRSDRPQLI
eukprot:COSAG01_NODE_2639_length_7326_cov_15.912550_3_plen_316_part_00